MERNPAARLIPLAQIARETPYGLRFDYGDSLLEASLEKRGVLLPLLVKEEAGQARLVSGHKRFFYAARKKGKEIPVIFIQEQFSEQELYFLSVFSNWNQNWPDLDRMVALRKGSEGFGLTSDELREDILPALGLPPGRGVLEAYQKVGGLSAEIHRLIHDGRIPFKGASSLARFPLEEQVLLAKTVFNKLHLTSSQLVLVSQWLGDLKKIRRAILADFLKEKELGEILEHPQMDFRTKGSRFFSVLRTLRLPKLSAEEKNFLRLKGRFEQSEEIRLEKPEGLEGEGVLLRARLKDRESLSRVIRFLESHSSSLSSFL